MTKRYPSPLSEKERRTLAHHLVSVATVSDAIQLQFEQAGYKVARVYQDAVLSLATSSAEVEQQQLYWKEVAKERFGCLGKDFSILRADYPDSCVYRSTLIDELRHASANRGECLEVAPLLVRFDGGRGISGGTSVLDHAIHERKRAEVEALTIAPGKPLDFTFATKDERYSVLSDLYCAIARDYGFDRDLHRTKAHYLCFSRPLAQDWDICWADESYRTPFVVRGVGVVTKSGWKFDTRQPSPGAVAKLRLNDLIPGHWRYLTDGDRRDLTLLGIRATFCALHLLSRFLAEIVAG